jgi:two-component system sensor histidine kinase KdpD
MNKNKGKQARNDWGEDPYSSQDKAAQAGLIAKNTTLTLIIMALATLLSLFFRFAGLHESTFTTVYILAVLVVAKQTDGYIYGILASVLGVLCYNFFFTVPYNTFNAYGPDYPVTFVIMLIAAVLTSTITAKAKQQARLSALREKRTHILLQITKNLLRVRSVQQIAEAGSGDIAKLLNRSVIFAVADSSRTLGEPYIFPFDNEERGGIFHSAQERQAITTTFTTGSPVGAGTEICPDSSAYYLPVKGQKGILGVVGVSCFDGQLLASEQKTLLEAVATQIALAMERERLSEEQQKSKMAIERERLRGNLLRAISHDLRTPLTGILGATATILDHTGRIEEKVKRELLLAVYEDASWLMQTVENILSLTRIDEGRIELKKNMEAVEEIVAEAVSRVKKLAQNHTLKINIPNELIMLPVDGKLIEQVLLNLIDNALKYTPFGSVIEIRAQVIGDRVVFEVEDNGNGIAAENLPFIFDRFYTVPASGQGRRGTGLGLAICKSIVTAHGGEISAYNNNLGGATFRFTLPLKG